MILEKMFLSDKYDRNKPVLVVGKGPTARFVNYSGEYYTACLNQSGRMVEKIDFQFIGDQKPYEDMLEDYVDRVDNLIFPSKFNQQNSVGDSCLDFVNTTLPNKVNKFAYTFCGPTVWDCHEIENVMKVSVMCTGELCFFWLLKQGFRNFMSVGIDKNCDVGKRRHEVFIKNGDCPDVLNNNLGPGWENFMFSRKEKLIKEFNANWKIL